MKDARCRPPRSCSSRRLRRLGAAWWPLACLGLGCQPNAQAVSTDLSGSTMVAVPANIAVGADAVSSVSFYARSGRGGSVAPASGKVRFAVPGCTVSPSTAVVDAAGIATAQVSSCQAGQHVVAATVVAADGSLSTTPTASTSVKGYYAADAAGTAVRPGTKLNFVVSTGYGFVGPLRFISSDPAAVLPTGVSLGFADHGVATLVGGVTLHTPGVHTIEAQESITGRAVSRMTVTVVAPTDAAGSLELRPLGAPVAGTALPLLVEVRDPQGARLPSFAGVLTVTSSDGRARLPVPYTMQPADGGTVVFDNVTLLTAGPQILTVTDGQGTAASLPLEVAPGPVAAAMSTWGAASGGAVTADGTATAALVLVARDGLGNALAGAAATFRASGNGATLNPPAAATNAAGAVAVAVASATAETKVVYADVGGITLETTVTFVSPMLPPHRRLPRRAGAVGVSAVVHDVDGDGRADLVTRTARGAAVHRRLAGGAWAAPTVPWGAGAGGVARLDVGAAAAAPLLVLGGYPRADVALVRPGNDAPLRLPTAGPVGAVAAVPAAAGTGAEIVVALADAAGGVQRLTGDASGAWAVSEPVPAPAPAVAVAAADLDADGRAEVAVLAADGRLALLHARLDGALGPAGPAAVGVVGLWAAPTARGTPGLWAATAAGLARVRPGAGDGPPRLDFVVDGATDAVVASPSGPVAISRGADLIWARRLPDAPPAAVAAPIAAGLGAPLAAAGWPEGAGPGRVVWLTATGPTLLDLQQGL